MPRVFVSSVSLTFVSVRHLTRISYIIGSGESIIRRGAGTVRHGEREVRAYSGVLEAQPQVGSRPQEPLVRGSRDCP